jgi:hypothetical protein
MDTKNPTDKYQGWVAVKERPQEQQKQTLNPKLQVTQRPLPSQGNYYDANAPVPQGLRQVYDQAEAMASMPGNSPFDVKDYPPSTMPSNLNSSTRPAGPQDHFPQGLQQVFDYSRQQINQGNVYGSDRTREQYPSNQPSALRNRQQSLPQDPNRAPNWLRQIVKDET